MTGPAGLLRLLLGGPRPPGRPPWEAATDPLLAAMRARRADVEREAAAIRSGVSWESLYGAEDEEGGEDGGAEGGGEGG